MTKTLPPWTTAQVAALQRWQTRGDVHPFTCPNHSDVPLTPHPEGWRCEACDYRQTWAHAFMLTEDADAS